METNGASILSWLGTYEHQHCLKFITSLSWPHTAKTINVICKRNHAAFIGLRLSKPTESVHLRTYVWSGHTNYVQDWHVQHPCATVFVWSVEHPHPCRDTIHDEMHLWLATQQKHKLYMCMLTSNYYDLDPKSYKCNCCEMDSVKPSLCPFNKDHNV